MITLSYRCTMKQKLSFYLHFRQEQHLIGCTGKWLVNVLQSWKGVKHSMRPKKFPLHNVKAIRDKVHKLAHYSSDAKYFKRFQNLLLFIPDMNDGKGLISSLQVSETSTETDSSESWSWYYLWCCNNHVKCLQWPI